MFLFYKVLKVDAKLYNYMNIFKLFRIKIILIRIFQYSNPIFSSAYRGILVTRNAVAQLGDTNTL